MDRRYFVVVLFALVAIVAASIALVTFWSALSDPLGSDQTYPAGAGPDHINFSALNADDANVSHTPRKYWDSYAIIYTDTAPFEYRFPEVNNYINSSTGEVITEGRHGAKWYRYGTVYVIVRPAKRIPNESHIDVKSDSWYVYDNATDAYYRYDSRNYGRLSHTNIGQHTTWLALDSYTWEAINTTTHHGVPVITYRLTETRTDNPYRPPTINGTLQLGVEDGIIYSVDITYDGNRSNYHLTYDVRPAPFPDHEWVDRARYITLYTTNSSWPHEHRWRDHHGRLRTPANTTNSSSEQEQLHMPW